MTSGRLKHRAWLMQRPHGCLLLLHLAPHQHGKLTLKNRVAEHSRVLSEHQQALELLRVEQTRHVTYKRLLWHARRLKLLQKRCGWRSRLLLGTKMCRQACKRVTD